MYLQILLRILSVPEQKSEGNLILDNYHFLPQMDAHLIFIIIDAWYFHQDRYFPP